MSTSSHRVSEMLHNPLLTPDYQDGRAGPRLTQAQQVSAGGSVSSGPFGYQRKHDGVSGIRVDTVEQAFRTIKPDDMHRAERAFHALTTKFAEAIRPTSRLDSMCWHINPPFDRRYPRYKIDQETRQDYATPVNLDLRLPTVQKVKRYADREWQSSEEVQQQLEQAIQNVKEHPGTLPALGAKRATASASTSAGRYGAGVQSQLLERQASASAMELHSHTVSGETSGQEHGDAAMSADDPSSYQVRTIEQLLRDVAARPQSSQPPPPPASSHSSDPRPTATVDAAIISADAEVAASHSSVSTVGLPSATKAPVGRQLSKSKRALGVEESDAGDATHTTKRRRETGKSEAEHAASAPPPVTASSAARSKRAISLASNPDMDVKPPGEKARREQGEPSRPAAVGGKSKSPSSVLSVVTLRKMYTRMKRDGIPLQDVAVSSEQDESTDFIDVAMRNNKRGRRSGTEKHRGLRQLPVVSKPLALILPDAEQEQPTTHERRTVPAPATAPHVSGKSSKTKHAETPNDQAATSSARPHNVDTTTAKHRTSKARDGEQRSRSVPTSEKRVPAQRGHDVAVPNADRDATAIACHAAEHTTKKKSVTRTRKDGGVAGRSIRLGYCDTPVDIKLDADGDQEGQSRPRSTGRSNKSAPAMNKRLVAAQELASKRLLLLDKFYSRYPDLPRTGSFPMLTEAYVDQHQHSVKAKKAEKSIPDAVQPMPMTVQNTEAIPSVPTEQPSHALPPLEDRMDIDVVDEPVAASATEVTSVDATKNSEATLKAQEPTQASSDTVKAPEIAHAASDTTRQESETDSVKPIVDARPTQEKRPDVPKRPQQTPSSKERAQASQPTEKRSTSAALKSASRAVTAATTSSTAAPNTTSSSSSSHERNQSQSSNQATSRSNARDSTATNSTSSRRASRRSGSRSRSRSRSRDRDDRRRREHAHADDTSSRRDARRNGESRRSRDENDKKSASPAPKSASSAHSATGGLPSTSRRGRSRSRSRSPSDRRRATGADRNRDRERERERERERDSDARRRRLSRSRSPASARSSSSNGTASAKRRESIRSPSPAPRSSAAAPTTKTPSSSSAPRRSSPRRGSRGGRDETPTPRARADTRSGAARSSSNAIPITSPRSLPNSAKPANESHDPAPSSTPVQHKITATVVEKQTSSARDTGNDKNDKGDKDAKDNKRSEREKSASRDATPSDIAKMKHINLSEYRRRQSEQKSGKDDASSSASSSSSAKGAPERPASPAPAPLDQRLTQLNAPEEVKIRLDLYFKLANRYKRMVKREQEKKKTAMATAYRFVMILNLMTVYEALHRLRADAERNVQVQSMSDWQSSVKLLTDLAEELQGSSEPVLAGLCFRLAAVAQQRALDTHLRVELADRRDQLAECAMQSGMERAAMEDRFTKASIAIFRADKESKVLEELWRTTDKLFTLDGLRTCYPSTWKQLSDTSELSKFNLLFSSYTPMEQIVPVVWNLVSEYARRHGLRDLPGTMPMAA